MQKETNFELSLLDRLHSRVNQFRLHARTSLAFSRENYGEIPTSPIAWKQWLAEWPHSTQILLQRLELKYGFQAWRGRLNFKSYQKNLATLWILEQILESRFSQQKGPLSVLEVGCQDFVRAPAISQFLWEQKIRSDLTGIEVDAFPILQNLHSRYDIARYYSHFLPHARYLAADFFTWEEPMDLILSFYPFVSPHPSLAWGLPHHYGDANRWVDGFERNLKAGGLVLVIHQGEWEEEEFDQAFSAALRRGHNLHRIHRQSVNCPFFPLPFPALASLYRKD